jgi:predicted neutral ceramidase superfamily lipid hydrolase
MYFLKKDTNENKYLKQRINDYWEYTISQITTLVLFDLMTAIISGICTGIFSDTPAANAAMFLTLMTTAWLGTAIVFVCRSLYTNHKYIAALCLVLIVLFSFADSNNNILIYINWVLPPVSNIIVTFQEHSNMVSVLPLVLRQLIYAIILFVISGFFNKKNYSK